MILVRKVTVIVVDIELMKNYVYPTYLFTIDISVRQNHWLVILIKRQARDVADEAGLRAVCVWQWHCQYVEPVLAHWAARITVILVGTVALSALS